MIVFAHPHNPLLQSVSCKVCLDVSPCSGFMTCLVQGQNIVSKLLLAKFTWRVMFLISEWMVLG